MSRGKKTIDLRTDEYRSSDGRFIYPRYPDRMHPFRRILCILLGAPLIGAGGWLFASHFVAVDNLSIRVTLAAGAMVFGGMALFGSGVTGR